MRLETIILINRAPFDKFRLDLTSENVIVLSGINGVGKTTILSHIVDAFYELAKKAYHNEFEHTSNKYYRISSGAFSLDNSKASIVYLRFRDNDETFFDYIDVQGKCNEGIYDDQIVLDGKIPYEDIKNNLEKSGNTKHWSISDNKAIAFLFENNLMTYFPAYRYETPSYLNDPYKLNLSFSTQMSMNGYLPNQIEVTSDFPQIANWIMDVVLDMSLYKGQTIGLFGQLNDVLTAILISKVNCRTRFGVGPRTSGLSRIAVMKRDVEGVQVYPSVFNMSSGELALLSLFGELVKQSDSIQTQINEVKGIVLVDEIDKHLHVRLQKEALPKLIKMFPNVQFIVSSHSPFLALGLQEEPDLKYIMIDLERRVPCLPEQTEIFRDVYNIMIAQNERFADKYHELQAKLTDSTKPIVITEGKTDWKHLKAALRRLSVEIDIDFFEFDDNLGDTVLNDLLMSYARIPQLRPIIGIFDRDNTQLMTNIGINDCPYKVLGQNVYAFAIPLVHEDTYGSFISIEHYYNREDLTKMDENGRRMFLGDEFYPSGNSKDGQYQTKISRIQNKISVNGIIDEKVYMSSDLEQAHSIALSKNAFAELIYSDDSFADGFDFSAFAKIFGIIGAIISENNCDKK